VLPIDYKLFQEHSAALRTRVRKEMRRTEAARLTIATLRQWQYLRDTTAMDCELVNSTSHKERRAVAKFAQWLSTRPTLESSFWLSSAYASLILPSERAEKAMFFTPPKLAARLIDSLLLQGASLETQTWHDPAGGGGAFLAPLAYRMVRHGKEKGRSPEDILKTVAQNITAVEIDPTLAQVAEQFVRMVVVDELGKGACLPRMNVKTADSLSTHVSRNFDVIICNPPYRKLTSSELDAHRGLFAEVIDGQSNLYCLFMKRCVELARPGALVGLLTPTSYQSGPHFAGLRSYLVGKCEILQIDVIHERLGVFMDVEQDASAVVLRKRSRANSRIIPTTVSRLERGVVQFVGTTILAQGADAWSIPKRLSDAPLIEASRWCTATLQDYGYSSGIGGFVAYRDERQTITREPTARDTSLYFPLIGAGDIKTNGRLEHGRHQRLRGLPLFVKNGKGLPRQSVEYPLIALQRVTSPDQKKRLVSAPVPKKLCATWGGVIGENHVVFLRKMPGSLLLTPRQMVQLLSSDAVDHVFRALSGVVNVSARDLNRLPLPDPVILKQLMLGASKVDNACVLEAYLETARQRQERASMEQGTAKSKERMAYDPSTSQE
jgi:adenine-specific DNA-methyltransferase